MAVHALMLANLVWLLCAASCSTQVAPQDANPDCLSTSLSMQNDPSNDPTQAVLLDTQHYRAGALVSILGESRLWLNLRLASTVTGDGWYDNNQAAGCDHRLTACDFTNGPQNNWLITQYINVSITDVIDINVKATFITSVGNCITGCVQTLPIRIYQTNTVNETGRNITSNYGDPVARLIHTTGNGQRRENDTHVISITPGTSGLYLALTDEGTCVDVSRLVVSYTVCPAQKLNLVSYPETVAPTTRNPEDKNVMGSCVNHASLTEGSLTLDCNFAGLWGSVDAVCQCDPGYQFINGSTPSCEACPVGKFKHTQGNTTCQPCLSFSSAASPASKECTCDPGYFRASFETRSDGCTAPPSVPLNLTNTSTTASKVTLTWSLPSNTGGRTDLMYRVNYTSGTATPLSMITPNTTITLIDLSHLTTYTIAVETISGVTPLDPDGQPNRTAVIITTTRIPLAPQNPDLNDRTITWQAPSQLFGETVLHYEILVSTNSDPSTARVVATVTGFNYTLKDQDLMGGSRYFIWVRAVTGTGRGRLSNPPLVITTPGGPVGLVVGVTVPVVLVVLLVILLLFCIFILFWKHSPKKEKYAPPSAPLNLRNTSTTDTTITLTWSPPSNTGGHTDLMYRVTYAAGTTTSSIETPNTTVTLTDLSHLTTYTISVETISRVAPLDPDGQPNRTAIITSTTRGWLSGMTPLSTPTFTIAPIPCKTLSGKESTTATGIEMYEEIHEPTNATMDQSVKIPRSAVQSHPLYETVDDSDFKASSNISTGPNAAYGVTTNPSFDVPTASNSAYGVTTVTTESSYDVHMASNAAYGVTTKLSSDVPITSNPAYEDATNLSSEVPMTSNPAYGVATKLSSDVPITSNPAYDIATNLSSDVPMASNPAYGVATKLPSDVAMANMDIDTATATPGSTR